MKVDCSALFKIGADGAGNAAAPLSPDNGNKDTREAEKRSEGHLNANKGIAQLQRRADDIRAALERARKVYSIWQQAERKAGDLKTEIIKGVKAGEDTEILFLKAVNVIGLLTNDDVTPRVIEKRLNERREAKPQNGTE